MLCMIISHYNCNVLTPKFVAKKGDDELEEKSLIFFIKSRLLD